MKRSAKIVMSIVLVVLIAVTAIGLAACDNGGLRFAAPDGTPALAMLRLASQKTKLDGKDVEYEVVSAANIAQEMTSGKADIVIMPVNAGATQIVKNGLDYKLVSIAVEGSLYLVGHKDEVAPIELADIKGKRIACIGQTGVPGLIFRYVMQANGINIVTDEARKDALQANEVYVSYANSGATEAATAYYNGQVDFIVVGEPAATAQKAKSNTLAQTDPQYARRLNCEMDMQAEYGKVSGLTGVDNYPQAGIFVKTSLTQNKALMRALFAALDENEDWIEQNADKVTEEAKNIGSASTFPLPSIPRCKLDCSDLDQEDANEILAFLKNVAPSAADWEAGKDKLFAFGLAT